MKVKKAILTLLIVVVSMALVAGIGIYLLDNTDKINQGNFRVNDAVLKSTIEILEKNQETETNEISNIIFDISQKNVFSMLIANNMDIKNMYLNEFKINQPVKVGKVYLSQANFDDKITDFSKDTMVNIYPIEKEGQYLVELNINNDTCVQDVNVPSETKLVKFDGTILDVLNIKVADLMLDISFNMNIVDVTGKTNTCKVALKMPTAELATNGIDVIRQNLADFRFKIK